MPSRRLCSLNGMYVVGMAIARSYSSWSMARRKTRESVPDMTIFMPMAAYTSESRAAESMKSRMRVASSTRTVLIPRPWSLFMSRFTDAMVSETRIFMYAVFESSSSGISSISWQSMVVFPVLRSPYRMQTRPSGFPNTYFLS